MSKETFGKCIIKLENQKKVIDQTIDLLQRLRAERFFEECHLLGYICKECKNPTVVTRIFSDSYHCQKCGKVYPSNMESKSFDDIDYSCISEIGGITRGDEYFTICKPDGNPVSKTKNDAPFRFELVKYNDGIYRIKSDEYQKILTSWLTNKLPVHESVIVKLSSKK